MTRQPRQEPADCPFCAGHEAETPEPTLVLGPAEAWLVRVFPNAYAAFDPPFGTQEVVAHGGQHRISLVAVAPAARAAIGEAWAARAGARRDAGYAHLFCSLNEGDGSGASLDHSHSQLGAFAEVPPLSAARHARFAEAAACPLCEDAAHARRKGCVVHDDGELLAWTPYASWTRYALRVAPAEHRSDAFADPALVSGALGVAAAAFARAFGEPPWNAWLETAPLAGLAGMHWHLEAFPRISTLSGIELGAGLTVCSTDPVQAAATLRGDA